MATFAPSSTITLGSLNLSGEDELGNTWITEKVDGWEGSPQSTLAVVQRARAAGGWAGVAYATPRSISAEGRVFAASSSALSAAVNRLNDECALDETLMVFDESGLVRSCMVRRGGDVIANTVDLTASWSIQVTALDPRKNYAPLMASTRLPSSTGGLAVPFTVPFAISAVQVSGQVSLFNPGNTTGSVVLRIDGPCVGPVVTHVSSGRSLVFSSSLVLGAGEWLEIDMDARSVLANGQSSRSGYVTGRGWSGFLPGENTYSFTAAGFDAGALLTVVATPADK